MAEEHHILNLGAGVQSTALYLMSLRRDEPEHVPAFDCAIFADTQEEPLAVYDHLRWLRSLGGPPILEATAGKLGDDLTNVLDQETWDAQLAAIAQNAGLPNGKKVACPARFTSVPAFTARDQGKKDGITRRQCTKEYKIEVIEQVIRRQILGLKPRQHRPKGVRVVQYLGLSLDEPSRIIATKQRFAAESSRGEPMFPLFDLRMTRADCLSYLAEVAPGREIPRSACVFCPFRRNHEWRHLRDTDPAGWARACQVDEAMRATRAICSIAMDDQLYLHESCVPLREASIDVEVSALDRYFGGLVAECEGYCGN